MFKVVQVIRLHCDDDVFFINVGAENEIENAEDDTPYTREEEENRRINPSPIQM